jgi:arabinogalactan endo-1,4-beta-galactosidase
MPDVVLCLALVFGAALPAASEGVFVSPVEGLSDGFLFAADVSSVLSLENSDVVYYDADGRPADLFALLKAAGFAAFACGFGWTHTTRKAAPTAGASAICMSRAKLAAARRKTAFG